MQIYIKNGFPLLAIHITCRRSVGLPFLFITVRTFIPPPLLEGGGGGSPKSPVPGLDIGSQGAEYVAVLKYL